MSAPTISQPTSSPAPALMAHQQQIHDFLVHRPFAAAWLGIGAGKTLTTLSVLQSVRPGGHILVIAPGAIARSTWIDEIQKWGFPIRTRSLIVDERDRKLNKDARLERFQQVFSDPPTMYFINRELLTLPSQRESLVHAVPKPGSPNTAEAQSLLAYLRASGPVTTAELLAGYRASIESAGQKPPTKTRTTALLRELMNESFATRGSYECRDCAGEGCPKCQFGLIDQLPIQQIKGTDGRKHPSLIWPFSTVIIDESQSFSSHDSNRFKALAKVRPAMTRMIQLTGSPIPNGLHDLWSQMYLLDQGGALGHNITAFRDRWFIPKMVYGTNVPQKWIPIPGAEEEIYELIRPMVISARNTNLQLPELTVDDVEIVLPQDLMDSYKDFKRDLVLDVVKTYLDENGKLTQSIESVIAENQAVLSSKLQQFASGTLYSGDPDESSTKGEYQVIHEEKLEMVEYLVRNNAGEPVLIPYHFKSDLEQLLKRFAKAGIDARPFDGSRQMIHDWCAKRIPVMLLHPASAGHGLNLQDGGSTMIWYTLPFSLEHYQQTNGRLYRKGQTQPVTIYRLIAKGTQDQRMPALLEEKAATQDQLIEAVDIERLVLAELEDEITSDLNDMWLLERI